MPHPNPTPSLPKSTLLFNQLYCTYACCKSAHFQDGRIWEWWKSSRVASNISVFCNTCILFYIWLMSLSTLLKWRHICDHSHYDQQFWCHNNIITNNIIVYNYNYNIIHHIDLHSPVKRTRKEQDDDEEEKSGNKRRKLSWNTNLHTVMFISPHTYINSYINILWLISLTSTKQWIHIK